MSTPDSQAAEKGMHAGDVIVEVAQEEVKNAGQINAPRSTKPRRPAANRCCCLVDRQGDLRFVALKIDQSSTSLGSHDLRRAR